MNTLHATARRFRLRAPRLSLSSSILLGLVLGIACGLFFGELCARLAIVGDIFIGLMRMTVLPYIMVSLIANLSRLSLQQSRRLALVGGCVLVVLWLVGLLVVLLLSSTFPEWKSGSFYSTSMTDDPHKVDFISLFIPSNVFAALSDNQIPAVVLMCICIGLAFSRLGARQSLISHMDDFARVLIKISSYMVRFAPLGVFSMAASTSGSLSLNELGRLQAYFVSYTAGAIFLAFVALPLLVTTLTPFRYRDILWVTKDAMATAFATGKLIIVLPLIVEQTEKLLASHWADEPDGAVPAADVLYPVAYPFPHVGKLLSMLFIPFSAWFLGSRVAWDEYPMLLFAGLFSYFGGPMLAIPHLLDMLRLPHDLFQLFLLTGVYGERLGDSIGVMHLVCFTLLTTSAFMGRLRLAPRRIFRYLAINSLLAVMMVGGLRVALSSTLQYVENRADILANMQLLEEPVGSVVIRDAAPNPEPLRPGETHLERIRRRGVIRVGYNEDKLPFAWWNVRGELVGFDVNMAHALAHDLGVTVEFVRFDRATLSDQLASDHFDVVMSGLIGTLERAESMQHTSSYMDVTLALVVPDYRVRNFQSLDALRSHDQLKIGFVDLSRGFVGRLRHALPDAELIELPSNKAYFQDDWESLDALLISAESGSAFTLQYPDFEVVVPKGQRVSLPLIYAVGGRDAEMRNFLEHWVTLRRKDGTMQEYYDHWILGKTRAARTPRWCVARDVLGWIE